MSRRTWTAVHSAICASSKLAELPDDTCRLFFHQLLQAFDSHGCIDARPHRLLAEVWPLLGKSIEETARCARELERVGLVVRRRDAKDEWLECPDWDEKAGALIHKRGKRRFGSDAAPAETPRQLQDQSRTSRGPVRECSGPPLDLPSSSTSSGSLLSASSPRVLHAREVDPAPPANPRPPRAAAPSTLDPEPAVALSARAREQIALHPALDVAAVHAAALRWENHLREHGRLDSWKSGTWASNLAKWSRWGPTRTVAAIDCTIGCGKFTPFEPTHGEAQPTATKPAPSAAEAKARADRAAYERDLERRWESLHTVEREMPSPAGGTVKRAVLEGRYPGHEAAERELRAAGRLNGHASASPGTPDVRKSA